MELPEKGRRGKAERADRRGADEILHIMGGLTKRPVGKKNFNRALGHKRVDKNFNGQTIFNEGKRGL